MDKMDSKHPSLFAGTLACILKRSGLVPTALVLSFGLLICVGPFVTWMRTLDETEGFIGIPHERDGLGAPSLFASTSACIQKRS